MPYLPNGLTDLKNLFFYWNQRKKLCKHTKFPSKSVEVTFWSFLQWEQAFIKAKKTKTKIDVAVSDLAFFLESWDGRRRLALQTLLLELMVLQSMSETMLETLGIPRDQCD